VDDELGVDVGQGVGHGGRYPGRLRPGRAVVPQPLPEVGAVEEIGDDVHLPLVQADVVDRYDAGVPEPGEPSGLLEGPFAVALRPAWGGPQHLDGHGPVELGVMAEVHVAEATRPQGATYLVTAEGRGRGLHRRLSGRQTRHGVGSPWGYR